MINEFIAVGIVLMETNGATSEQSSQILFLEINEGDKGATHKTTMEKLHSSRVYMNIPIMYA